jgi:hypothetical protein
MNREDFFKRTAPRVKKVKTLDGQDIYIRAASVADGQLFNKMAKGTDPTEQTENAITLFIQTACDEHGTRILTEDDREALRECDQEILTDILQKAADFNKTSASAVEETKKNSRPIAGDASVSDSPPISG